MARTWASLTPDYRARLARHGITQAQFDSGVKFSREAARGHAATPERPERAQRNRERYEKYLVKRQHVADHLNALLRQAVFDRTIDRYDAGKVDNMVLHASTPTLRIMATVTIDELREYAQYQTPREQRNRTFTRSDGSQPMPWFVLIDGHWYNPFWYH